MPRTAGSTINIGEAVRNGLQLRSREAVALVHEACMKLEAGVAARLPTSIDELWVNAAGLVAFPAIGKRQEVQAAVAILLEALLATVNVEAETVPSALSSLPRRLREAATERSSVIRDLLSILRWHVRDEPRQVLRNLVARVTSAGVVREMPLRAVSAAGIKRPHDLELSMTGPRAAEPYPAAPFATAPSLPAQVPDSQSRRPFTWASAASALIVLSLSGYAGYRYASLPRGADSSSLTAATQANSASPGTAQRDGEPYLLTLPVSGGAFSPSFAAQQHMLLFHAGQDTSGRLYSATLDDRGVPSDVKRLLDEPARNYHARLSPDGEWIAFDSDRDGERGVYVADKTGTGISRMSGDGFGARPSWSPDMRSLAFVRAEPGRPEVWNLWIRTLATRALSRVTNYPQGQVSGASWLPDSASYAYSHEQALIIADRSGRQLAAYPSPVPGRMVRTPAVSPDGRQIVFQVVREGVWLLDLATGTMHALLDDPSAEDFAWDPSGRRIAYHSRRDGEWRIWVLAL